MLSLFRKQLKRNHFINITLFEIFIFCPKIQLWFPEKIVDFIWVKNSWICCGFGLFSCWQLWFHEKNYQKKFGWKIRENVAVFFVKIEFLDKNLTFWIVCICYSCTFGEILRILEFVPRTWLSMYGKQEILPSSPAWSFYSQSHKRKEFHICNNALLSVVFSKAHL